MRNQRSDSEFHGPAFGWFLKVIPDNRPREHVRFLVTLCTVSCLACGFCIVDAHAASRSPVRAQHGMVVTAHPAASEAGVAMLEHGGNAVDAAVAAALVAGVVEPYSAGLGGGGFMLVYSAETKKTVVIDYRETAPAAASRDMYVDADGNAVPEASLVGHRAAGTPGTAAGLSLALTRHGTLPFSVVAEPAIRWAEQGFPAHEAFIENSNRVRGMLQRFDETARVFLNNENELYASGEMVVQTDLARTLRAIADKGPDAFYGGPIADAIVEDMRAHGGLITTEDLAGYRPRTREPVRGVYRGHRIVTMPPPSSGGVHLIQMLNILEGYDLEALGYGSSRTIHVMAETMRRAYADRSKYLGDPAFADVPVAALTSKEYADDLRAQIDLDTAGNSDEIGPGNLSAFQESDHTTHISVVDGHGNAVSMTQTINGPFGCGVVVPGTGILLNNEMDDFVAKPGVPNRYGLTGGEANAVAPGKIPLSSMTPTLVFKDDHLFMVAGSPGGARIITTVLQIILNVLDHGMDIREAIDAPRIHHQWLPDEVRLEPLAAPEDVVQALETRGHGVIEKDVFGNAMAILVDPETGELLGAADPRGVGQATGY